ASSDACNAKPQTATGRGGRGDMPAAAFGASEASSSPTDRCYRCDEPGHVARDCPAPAPTARTTKPQGNGVGAV
uniref:CCHC-type domain-containing protein n=1 Tax=Oreochromis niloticus TaxID=8128 RepID=A0A669DFW2_ORENI